MFIKVCVSVFALLFIVATLLPFVRSDYWTFRILEYPRLQKLIIGLVILILVIGTKHYLQHWFWWLSIPLSVSIIYLFFQVLPYTFLGKKEMLHVAVSKPENELKIFTANVLQYNTAYDSMLMQIESKDPDIVFLLETDEKWMRAMEGLLKRYPNTELYPLDNTYGMLFYTRLSLQESKINFIVESDVPSLEATVLLKSGEPVKIFGLHPKPPVPSESVTSTAKDKELMKVALQLEHFKKPCIVMGDLNDVAWSNTTKLFRKVSSLIDPRRGRGFYSTFSAEHKWMRFPLDYIFCSSHFGLVSMERLPYNGSDHFPMFIHIQYNEALPKAQKEPEADADDKEEAKEKAKAK